MLALGPFPGSWWFHISASWSVLRNIRPRVHLIDTHLISHFILFHPSKASSLNRHFRLTMSSREILHAYRHLYRELLRAVRFATPARYTARDQIRKAFRQPGEFDQAGLKRTIWFLKAAAKETGMEHKILKTLLRVAWHREVEGTKVWKGGKGCATHMGTKTDR